MQSKKQIIPFAPKTGIHNHHYTLVDQILSRNSISPKRQCFPAPSQEEVELMVQASFTAPDHCDLKPCAFIEIPIAHRQDLAQIFLSYKLSRGISLDKEVVSREISKAMSSPTLIAVYAKLDLSHPKVPVNEQLVATGAAIQNFLLCAHSLGYGCILLSGERTRDPNLSKALGLSEKDSLIGFISIGSVRDTAREKYRGDFHSSFSTWRGARSKPAT